MLKASYKELLPLKVPLYLHLVVMRALPLKQGMVVGSRPQLRQQALAGFSYKNPSVPSTLSESGLATSRAMLIAYGMVPSLPLYEF